MPRTARKTMSERQLKMLDFIRGYFNDFGIPPSIRDIVTGCKISSTSVADYNLKHLERAGYIRRHKDVSRGIELLGAEGRPRQLVPLLGKIAAGRPIPVPDVDTWKPELAAENVDVPETMIGHRKNVFALKVRGNSMIDALVNDGDIVIMQAANDVENGQMAAVWLKSEKEATLKRVFKQDDGKIRLQPANALMTPMYENAKNVVIQGRVIGVLRKVE
ncbi:MAG: transcriptional repressor LexA [Dehalogenimonas sp.]|uniref:LexA repressor n=1 Tax=Candidatus Dehalogenimonas loeffleri TaxID=3127115 RepID=A0ABZ2J526_9CHLR|nr:transcriptional repressor LexA [Dehalogenimonas sp.]